MKKTTCFAALALAALGFGAGAHANGELSPEALSEQQAGRFDGLGQKPGAPAVAGTSAGESGKGKGGVFASLGLSKPEQRASCPPSPDCAEHRCEPKGPGLGAQIGGFLRGVASGALKVTFGTLGAVIAAAVVLVPTAAYSFSTIIPILVAAADAGDNRRPYSEALIDHMTAFIRIPAKAARKTYQAVASTFD
ncbi:MAG: hypothetical protein HY554_00175 [Elusimicrobia bacterium]|nr:hypothetical protein [Elusimicrobiota bacterium]